MVLADVLTDVLAGAKISSISSLFIEYSRALAVLKFN